MSAPLELLRVLALSARDGAALAEARERLADHLERQPGLDPDDIATTLHLGRERFAVRGAVVGRTTAELARALRTGQTLTDDSPAHRAAAAWCQGLDVDTTLGRPGRRVRLPGYAFQRVTAETAVPEAGDRRPLTPHEQRWLFHDLVRAGGSADHNVTAVVELPGSGGPEWLAELADGFAALQRLHPELRTVFTERGGRWSARTEPGPVALTRADGQHLDPAATARSLAGSSFALRDGPLVRCVPAEGPDGRAVALGLYEPLSGRASAEALLTELLELCPTPVLA